MTMAELYKAIERMAAEQLLHHKGPMADAQVRVDLHPLNKDALALVQGAKVIMIDDAPVLILSISKP
jgi:hypothetical protein